MDILLRLLLHDLLFVELSLFLILGHSLFKLDISHDIARNRVYGWLVAQLFIKFGFSWTVDLLILKKVDKDLIIKEVYILLFQL